MSEPARTTTAYKTLLARAILGETVNLLPAELVLGTGAYDSATQTVRPPQETPYAPASTGYALTVTRLGASVTASVTVTPGSDPIAFNELAVRTADGTWIMHRTLAPQLVTAGVGLLLRIELLPPEGL